MAGLRKLADGQFYVLTGGKEFLDHHGNVYTLAPATPPVSVPHVASPAAVASPKRKAPTTPLPARTQDYLDSIVMGLVKEPREHFVAVGLSESGAITFTEEQQGEWNHCDVDMKAILTQLGKHTAGLYVFHNHPDGSVAMSHQDEDVTRRLTAALKAYDVTLLAHQVVAGDIELQEATRPALTTYDLREARDARLWRGVGGPPPMPWGRWPSRQTETLPSEYPRDGFDVQTMTDQLEEAARAILHSVPLDVAKRIMQTVSQRLGVPA